MPLSSNDQTTTGTHSAISLHSCSSTEYFLLHKANIKEQIIIRCIFLHIIACDCSFFNCWNSGPADSNSKLQMQEVHFPEKHYFCGLFLWSLTT